MNKPAFSQGFTRNPIYPVGMSSEYNAWFNRGRASFSTIQGLHVKHNLCPFKYLANRVKVRLRDSRVVYVWLRGHKVVMRTKDTQVDSALLVGVYTEITRDELRGDVIYSFLESFGGEL